MHLTMAVLLATQLASGSDELLLKVGEPAPPFSMRDLDRKVFSLANHTGPSPTEPKKAILMAFFATWCKPCMKEIPIIKKIYARWKDKGVEVVYLGLSQGAKDLGPFAQKEKLPWRVVPDSFGLLGRRYGASQLPHLFIVDADARIAFQHRGIAEDLQAMVENQLARLTGEPVPPGAEAVAAAKPRFDKTYTLGRVPSGGGSADRWQPLAAYLSEGVGANIEMTSAASYEAFEKKLKAGTYDIGNAGPLLCHAVRKKYEPLVRVERQDSPTYLGLLFALRSSKLKHVTELKGKTVGLVSKRSTSGGLYPQKLLLDEGLVPGKDVKITWLGSHHAVAEAVRDGKVDAGACYEDCRDVAWPDSRAKAIATRVLAYTSEIPGEMIIVKRSLNDETKAALKKALLAVNEQKAILTQMSQSELTVTGIFEAKAEDLAGISAAIKQVKAKKKARKK